MQKVVLLNSGGLDSALLAKYLKKSGYEVHSLFIDTNQLNRESTMAASQRTAELFCVSHKVIELNLGQHSNLYHTNGEYRMYDDVLPGSRPDRPFACPMMSMLFYSIGSAYAQTIYAELVIGGFKGNYKAPMQDAFNELIYMNPLKFYNVPINAPLSDCTTYVSVTQLLDVDFSNLGYTHSCVYNEPCGVCDKCTERNGLEV